MNLESLDLAIGMIVVFLLVSTLCSAVREGIESVLKTRAAYLERALRELLDDQDGTGLTKTLFEHPLLSGLFMGAYQPRPLAKKWWLLANGRGLPSYVPPRTVARALLDITARGSKANEVSDPASEPLTVQAIRARLQNIENARVRRVILHALDTSANNLDQATRTLEDWFNDSMDRVSGWYKRSTQWVLFVIAITVAVAMNVDSLGIARHFSLDAGARKEVVTSAEALTARELPTAEAARKVLYELELPIGWSGQTFPKWDKEGLTRVLGWLLTAIAATLGAPFWFDLLNKVMVVRSTVRPRARSPEELSEDRQPTGARLPARAVTAPAAIASAPAAAHGAAALIPTALDPIRLPLDSRDERDGCDSLHDAASGEATKDEELPAATGGVAQ